MQAFGYSLPDATEALAEMRKHLGGFIDSAPSPKLAPWATTAPRISDAFLVQIAEANGLILATYDEGIDDPPRVKRSE